MNSSLSDILKIEEKKALYGTLFLTCLTPGILYLFLKHPTSLSSLSNKKTILIGLAGASPCLALNMVLAFIIAYFLFTREKYRSAKPRLEEKVINRVALTSGIVATSLCLNLYIVALYLMGLSAPSWFKYVAMIADLVFVGGLVFLMKWKVDQDLEFHDFGG